MITIYNDPTMFDFLRVAARMPQDEIDHIEAFTGQPFTIDGAAVGAFTVTGPKWVAKVGDEPIAVGGFIPERPGVWRDFMLNTPDAFSPENYREMTRHCRRILNSMFKGGYAHRIECITPLQRLESRKELERWYSCVGYHKEAVLDAYLANKYPAVIFARVNT